MLKPTKQNLLIYLILNIIGLIILTGLWYLSAYLALWLQGFIN